MEVKVENSKSSDFKQVYAIGAIGGHSPYDFRIAFYNDSPKTLVEDGKSMTVMERKIDTEIILSPLAAKELANWLVEHIKDYEKVFGEIKRPGSVSTGPAVAAKGSESAAIQGYM
jgi:outer membrane lipoprotein-sorting protein